MNHSLAGNTELLRYRLKQGFKLLPAVLSRPTRIPWLLHGASPGRLMALDVDWLRNGNIRTVLDIGANVGQFARTVQQLLPEASIHSFEPLGDCYEMLVQRMAGKHNFRAYKLALGEQDGISEFQRNDFSQSSSVLPMAALHRDAFSWSAQTTPVSVDMRRLDTVVDQAVLARNILVKIDVQGYEDRVLLGGEQTIRAADVVIIETSLRQLYEGQASFDDVYETMKRYGFQYSGNMDQLVSPHDGTILQVDALFRRSERDRGLSR